MKKLLIILGSIIGLLFLTIILVPFLFKDKIFETVQKEIDKSVNANINLDPSNFSLSLLSNFPNITVGIEDFSITNKAPFEGDTLFAAQQFSIELDLISVINDAPIQINGITLNKPVINILVLEDGTANYDITVPSEESEETADESSSESIKIGVDHWEITDGTIGYFDQAGQIALSLKGVDHSGSGDFTLSVFDMNTSTSVKSFNFAYENVVYVSDKTLQADLLFGMDLDNMKFTFKEASAKVNELGLGFDGFFAMPTDDYEMDINFKADNNSFKSVLSLVPGMYAEGFDDLETNGTFDLSGYVKGVYNETQMPGFRVALNVKDAYVKSAEVPVPIEKIALDMVAESKSGDMKEGTLVVNNFGLNIDKDRFTAKAKVNNFDSPSWDLTANGKLNLDIISKIEPTTDFSIGGVIIADLNSAGNYAAVEAEAYDQLKTSGTLQLLNFSYVSADYPEVKISKASMSFDPKNIALSDMQGNFGKTDFTVSGQLSNYLAYALDENALLVGNMSLNANVLDVNEMMGESEESTEESTDTTAMELVVVPKDIDFTFKANINTIVYDNFNLKNAVGVLKIQNGILTMDPLSFQTLGGSIKMVGNYNTENELDPKFNFDLDISELSIPETFKNVVTVQKFIPVAEKMTGKFSTNFNLNGAMTQEMMPDFETLNGAGLIKLAQAAVKDSKVISGITSLSKLDKTNTIELNDVKLKAQIKDGRFSVEPFDIKYDKYKATIDGYTTFTGKIGYNFMLNVPTGSLGTAANQAISNLLGSKTSVVGNSVNMNFNIGGTYDDPQVKLGKTTTEGGQSVSGSVKSAVNDKIDEEKEKLKAEAEEKIQQAKDSAKNEAERLKKKAEEEAKKKAEEEAKKLKDKAKNKIKDLFGGGGL